MAYTKTTVLRVSHNTLPREVLASLSKPANQPREVFLALARWFERLAAGFEAASVELIPNGDLAKQASGTATLVNVVAGDTFTVNGVTFTAVASGATAVQFNLGADDAADAANLAAKINASSDTNLLGYVTASAASNVVTVTAVKPGFMGNAIQVAQTGNHITLSPTTRLGAGAGDVNTPTTFSRS